jgi:hypothetical protein
MEMLMEIVLLLTTVTIGEPIKVTVSASATNVSCNGQQTEQSPSGSDGSVITINGLAPAATWTWNIQ